jgi:inorganic pyrophosphatase/exopolyphosphatase
VSRFQSLIDWKNNADVSLLLLGVILLDTYAENPKFAKNTPIDDQAVDVLSHCLDKSDHHKLFEELADAKFDPSFWASLSASDCLRYDYKRFATMNGDGRSFSFGTSSVLLPLSHILTKGDLSIAAMKYLHHADADERVDACAILSLVTDPATKRPHRELLVVSTDATMLSKFRAFATGNAHGDILPQTNLLLEEVPVTTEENLSPLHFALFRQGNAAASRKQVAPALQHFACDFLAGRSP